MKILAVGDLHTKLWIIDEIERLVGRYDAIVFVGDYLDDWNTVSLTSIDFLRQLILFSNEYSHKIICLQGNHDYIYVNNTPSLQSGYNTITQLLINSPENEDMREWLRSRPITYVIDDIVYSHAGVTS